MKKLKLFVWHNVLTDYTPGIMFALAPTVEEARIMIVMKDRKVSRAEAKMMLSIGFGRIVDGLRKPPEVVTKREGFAVWGGG